jgi:hypothetical protein
VVPGNATATTHNHAMPLTVCVYGSSSKRTPQKYLEQAHKLGVLLAEGGHLCINGAGKVRVEQCSSLGRPISGVCDQPALWMKHLPQRY